MYKAIIEKDTFFEGIFFTAVKTTGIFCRPSCTARKPKLKNVDFFKTSDECILNGYRPCKVCNPLETIHQIPDKYQEIISELSLRQSLKIKDSDLRQRGVEPSQIRRWFLKNHGITFHRFQRLLRVNIALNKIQTGKTITHTAFETGFESLSGFGYTFKNVFGTSPKHTKKQHIIYLKRIETPLGTIVSCASDRGICFLEFADHCLLERSLKSVGRLLNGSIIPGDNKHFISLETQLKEYFEGRRQDFSIPLQLSGTDFQNTVWTSLQSIPYGTTKTYKEQAEAIGMTNRNRARDLALAASMNLISILIPCHRVIGANRKLNDHNGEPWRKKHLLELEKTRA